MSELNQTVVWQPAGTHVPETPKINESLVDPVNAVMHHFAGSVARRIHGVNAPPDPFQMIDRLKDVIGSQAHEAMNRAREAALFEENGSEATDARSKARNVVQNNGELFRKDFVVWLMKNWHIWRKFEAESDRVWAMGRKTYSARTLIEYIRHETTLREIGGEYKINNSYVPDIGRLYNMLNPDKGNFFECRVMQAPTIRTTIRSSAEFSAQGRFNELMASPKHSGDFSA